MPRKNPPINPNLFYFNDDAGDLFAVEPGFYLVRMAPGSPLLPASLRVVTPKDDDGYIIADQYLEGSIGYEPGDPKTIATKGRGRGISEETYNTMMADLIHAQKFRPGDPKNSPNAPTNFLHVAAGNEETPQDDLVINASSLLKADATDTITLIDVIKRVTVLIAKLKAKRKTCVFEVPQHIRDAIEAIDFAVNALEVFKSNKLELVHQDRMSTYGGNTLLSEYGASAYTADVHELVIDDEKIIDRKYLKVDESALKAALMAIRGRKDVPPILGAHIKTDKVTRIS